MAYVKNTWVDQEVERPKTYEMTNNADGSVTLIDSFGLVSELGTPVNADNMNHIEEGIEEIHNLVKVEDGKFYYNNGMEWSEVESGGAGLPLLHIGQSLYVDESKGLDRYLNGQVVEITTQYTEALNALKAWRNVEPQYFGTEEQWQAAKTLSVNGLVNMFVIADDDSTVRLPNYPDFITTLNDWQGDAVVMGNGMTLGVTDGTNFAGVVNGSSTTYTFMTKSTFYGVPAGTAEESGNDVLKDISIGLTTDGTKSGVIADIQQERITLKYFIRLATGQETIANITNELTTNNPCSLFDYKYSDHELFNASWIKGTTVFYQKSVYVTAYEALQVEYNTEVTAGTEVTLPSGYKYVKQGLSVKLSTEAFTDRDFVIDTDAESFRCALKTGTEPYQLPNTVPVMGNGICLGLTNGTELGGIWDKTNDGAGVLSRTQIFGNEIGFVPTDSESMEGASFGIATKAQLGNNLANSGIIADLSEVQRSPNVYLYFYVGDTVQNAALINAGRLAEQIADIKQDINNTSRGYLVESYVEGTSWYRVYSDGWIEQGGFVEAAAVDEITFLKAFTTDNVTALRTEKRNKANSSYYGGYITEVTSTGMVLYRNLNGDSTKGSWWLAYGY